MTYQRLEITDGTIVVDLLRGSFGLQDWQSQEPDIKGGGVWLDNPLENGRQIAIRKVSNYVETFTLAIHGETQGEISRAYVALKQILSRATAYFTDAPLANQVQGGTNNQLGRVYLLVQGMGEASPRFSQILDYRAAVGLASLVGSMITPSPSIDGWPLIIEHGNWYLGDPTSPTFDPNGLCVPIGADQSAMNISNGIQEAIAANTDDCEVNITAMTLNTGGNFGIIGNSSGTSYGIGLRFTTIPIAFGSTIKSAWLVLAGAFSSNADAKMVVSGEKSVSAATFSTYANYVARVRTSNKRYWQFPSSGNSFSIFGLEDIIQEIIDQGGWIANNNLALFVEDNGSSPGKFFSAYMREGAVTTAYLNILTGSGDIVCVVADTCNANSLFAGNYDQEQAVNGVIHYDASTGVYTNLIGTPLPWTLLPAVPAVGDILYISAYNVASGGLTVYPFGKPSNIVFQIGAGAVDITGIWEIYVNVPPFAWATATNFIDYTNNLKNPGTRTVHLQLLDNAYPSVAVNGIVGQWVRFRITAVGAAPTPPTQITRPIYVAWHGSFDIEAANISSDDLAPSGMLRINPISGSAGTPSLTCDELWIGSRSINRGDDFSAFIPIVHPNYLARTDITVIVDILSCFDWGFSPYGFVFQLFYVGVATGVVWCQIGLQDTALEQYRGQYRVFLRRYYSATCERAKYRIKIASVQPATGPFSFIGEWVQDTNNPTWDIIDLGVITLPPQGVSTNDLRELWISIEVDSTGGFTTWFSDLILMPVDEWWAHTQQNVSAVATTYIPGYAGNELVVDGITEEGKTSITVQDQNGTIIYRPTSSMSGNLKFRTDKDVRYWLLGGTYTTGCTNYRRRWFPAITFGVRAVCDSKVIGLG